MAKLFSIFVIFAVICYSKCEARRHELTTNTNENPQPDQQPKVQVGQRDKKPLDVKNHLLSTAGQNKKYMEAKVADVAQIMNENPLNVNKKLNSLTLSKLTVQTTEAPLVKIDEFRGKKHGDSNKNVKKAKKTPKSKKASKSKKARKSKKSKKITSEDDYSLQPDYGGITSAQYGFYYMINPFFPFFAMPSLDIEKPHKKHNSKSKRKQKKKKTSKQHRNDYPEVMNSEPKPVKIEDEYVFSDSEIYTTVPTTMGKRPTIIDYVFGKFYLTTMSSPIPQNPNSLRMMNPSLMMWGIDMATTTPTPITVSAVHIAQRIMYGDVYRGQLLTTTYPEFSTIETTLSPEKLREDTFTLWGMDTRFQKKNIKEIPTTLTPSTTISEPHHEILDSRINIYDEDIMRDSFFSNEFFGKLFADTNDSETSPDYIAIQGENYNDSNFVTENLNNIYNVSQYDANQGVRNPNIMVDPMNEESNSNFSEDPFFQQEQMGGNDSENLNIVDNDQEVYNFNEFGFVPDGINENYVQNLFQKTIEDDGNFVNFDAGLCVLQFHVTDDNDYYKFSTAIADTDFTSNYEMSSETTDIVPEDTVTWQDQIDSFTNQNDVMTEELSSDDFDFEFAARLVKEAEDESVKFLNMDIAFCSFMKYID